MISGRTGESEKNMEPRIGDLAVCIDSHAGIVTAVKDSYYGRMIFVVEADRRVYHFHLYMIEEDWK